MHVVAYRFRPLVWLLLLDIRVAPLTSSLLLLHVQPLEPPPPAVADRLLAHAEVIALTWQRESSRDPACNCHTSSILQVSHCHHPPMYTLVRVPYRYIIPRTT